MRILVVTNLYPPHHLGGYELSCRDVVERWRARGHSVEVLTSDTRVPGAEGEEDDPQVRRVLGFYWRDYQMVRRSFLEKVRMERANQLALHRALDELRPDVVSVWHMGAMSLGLLRTISERRVPMVWVVCDDWLVYGPQADLWMHTFAKSPWLRRAASFATGLPTSITFDLRDVAVCFVSESIRRKALERSEFSLARSTVVYSGIDRRDFPGPANTERPWNWRLLSVGRVEERKGIHVAIEALARLQVGASLEIVGPAHWTYRKRLEQMTKELRLDDRVRFSDPLPRTQLRELYSAADVVLFPVLWDEPFGLVPIEAMACGTPVVATGTGGSDEFLVDGKNCLVVRPGDPSALAAAVTRLAADPVLRHKIVGGGVRTAEVLDVDLLADVLESWHEGALQRFTRGAPPDRPSLRALLERSA